MSIGFLFWATLALIASGMSVAAVARHYCNIEWREWNESHRHGTAPDGLDRNGDKPGSLTK